LASREAVQRIRAVTDLPFTVRSNTFSISFLGKQVVCCRVHWLPVVVSDNAVGSLSESYGTVLKVERELVDGRGNGVRKVFLEVDVAQKIGIPHMFEFSDRLRALVTLTGRAPLCLKCGEVGHIRFGCPSSARVAGGPGQAFSRPAPREAQEVVAPTAAQTFSAPVKDPP